MDELLELSEYFDNQANRDDLSLAPVEFKYALETKVNRDLRAGYNNGNNRDSHVFLIEYTIDQDGKISANQFDYMYNDILEYISNVESLGGLFCMVDIEIASGNRVVVDVMTVVGYVNTDLSFGYNPLPEGNSYQVLKQPFINLINDRIIFEAIDTDEYFLTDIYPNPALEPFGLNIYSVQIIGLLGLSDCWMYSGTLELYGGPELVYGNDNENVTMNAGLANDYIMRGINNIESLVPPNEGYQLIQLKLGLHYNQYAAQGQDCLPGDGCNTYYPCHGYSHAWSYGFAAKKVLLEK